MRFVLSAVLAFLITGTAWAAGGSVPGKAHQRYKWTDGEGALHYSDSLPPEAVKYGFEIVNAQGVVLDLACGSGRHSRLLASLGFQVHAVDRDIQGLAAPGGIPGVIPTQADLEGGRWPFDGLKFDGIVVTNYLHRPLFPRILDSLAPAGVLIYETFAAGNERFGKPSNPAFLLRPGELLDVAHGRLRVVAYEDLEVATPRPARIQRICAVRLSTEV